jgi:hypothetical protein
MRLGLPCECTKTNVTSLLSCANTTWHGDRNNGVYSLFLQMEFLGMGSYSLNQRKLVDSGFSVLLHALLMLWGTTPMTRLRQ